MVRTGSWCDVYTQPAGRVGWARVHNKRVIFSEPDGDVEVGIAAGVDMLYLRAASDRAGRLCAVGVNRADDHAYAVTSESHIVDLGPCATPFGVEIEAHDREGWWAYVQDSPTTYQVTHVASDGTTTPDERFTIGKTSQGFLDVKDGTITTKDAGEISPSPLIVYATERSGLYVGQLKANGIALYDATTGNVTTLFHGLAPTLPHIAQDADGAFCVCCWRADGSWVARVARPLVPDVVVVDPPPPPPPDEEKPVQFEPKHSDLIEAYADRFGLPDVIPGDIEGSKELARPWVRKLAETFKARFPSEGWGWKRASNGRPLSSESIARRANGRLWGYDLLLGGGAPGQTLAPRADAEDISDQVFVEVNTFDHLLTVVDPPDPEEPDEPNTPTPVDLRPVLQRLDTLTVLVQQLLARPDAAALWETVGGMQTDLKNLSAFVQHDAQGKLLVLDNKLDQLLSRREPERCRFRFGLSGGAEAPADDADPR